MNEFDLKIKKILSENPHLDTDDATATGNKMLEPKGEFAPSRKEYEIVSPFARRSSGLPSGKVNTIYRR